MSKRVLVTGVSGQDGGYLVQQLLAAGNTVLGTARGTLSPAQLSAVPELGQIELIELDLLDSESVRQVVETSKVEEIYHLAAPTFVPDSLANPQATLAAIAGATETILQTAASLPSPPKVLVTTSSEIFGDCGASPQNEETPKNPRSPYGEAKLAAHVQVQAAREELGLFAVSAITFNHESPRRPLRFLSRKVTAGVAAIAAGEADGLTLGALDAVRDWSHAADITRGLQLALRHESADDYVFASGVGHTVGELVDAAFQSAGVDRFVGSQAAGSGGLVDRVSVDPQFVRPPEPWPLVGDAARARTQLSWQPEYTFEQLISEMVQSDLASAGASAGAHD